MNTLHLPNGMQIYKVKPTKLKDIIRCAILAANVKHAGNRYAMAIELGISRSTLYRHLEAYGIATPGNVFKRKGESK